MKGYVDHWAVDLDDVVLDLTGGVRRTVAREHGVEVPEFDSWNMDLILKPILGQPWMKWMRSKDWLWATFPAIDGAIGGLETLRRRGIYLECVTSKPEWAEPQVWKWLGLWRPPFNRVTIMGDGTRKVDVTDATLLVDDKPQNCQEFLDEGRRAILFTRPHNLDVRARVRCDDWRGILTAQSLLFSTRKP